MPEKGKASRKQKQQKSLLAAKTNTTETTSNLLQKEKSVEVGQKSDKDVAVPRQDEVVIPLVKHSLRHHYKIFLKVSFLGHNL